MRPLKLTWIIHIFALLHAVVALGCRIAGVDDELLLTVLTMALALIIGLRKGLSIEFTASIVIVMNIIGFLLGTFGADFLSLFIPSDLVVSALSTAATTEILGWSVIAMTKIFRQDTNQENRNASESPYLKWLILVVTGIFIIRLLIVLIFPKTPFDGGNILEMIREVLSSTVPLIILICINIIYVRYAIRGKKKRKDWQHYVNFILFMVLTTMMESLFVGFGLPFNLNKHPDIYMPLLIIVAFMTQVTIYCIIYMINYAVTTRDEMHVQREKANMAQYRYQKLKRQVNPHFLFNSLNILDCLICEEKTEQASLYTHKLAGIYRYMIKSEDEELVPLRDELVFVNLYIDLLKVRFPVGFEVDIDVPESMMSCLIPPCSIQLLIENATKHNAVNEENPLIINVKASGDHVSVCNNIRPKVTKSPSTGLGQKYIRQLYMDISGKAICIEKADNEYCVTLPLL